MSDSNLKADAPFYPHVAEGPQNVSAYWIEAQDNIRLRIAHWHPKTPVKGTVFVFQGRSENLEKYGRAAEVLHRSGYAVFGIDWRGQGLSDRLTGDPMAGYVGQFNDYQNDVRAMIAAAEMLDLPKPWYLIGHSLGACIGLRAMIEGFAVSACAFTAPLWGINLTRLQRLAALPLSWAAQSIGLGHLYAPGTRGESYVLNTEFEVNRLTNDPDMYKYYTDISEALPDQQIGGPSMQWLFQALKETRALARLTSPDIPCITFCGAEDSIVAVPAAKERMERWPQGQLELVDCAKHDVLHEIPSTRLAVFDKILKQFSQNSIHTEMSNGNR